MKAGEEAARSKLPQILALIGPSMQQGKIQDTLSAHLSDSVFISRIEYQGLHNVSAHFVNGKILFQPPCNITVDDIESSVNRIYGTQFFDKVLYQLIKTSDGEHLVLKMDEKNYDQLRIQTLL
jgi:outer membrane protein assembly factor BamA